MFYFRLHRGGLRESVETTKTYDSIFELLNYEKSISNIEYYCYDDRFSSDCLIALDRNGHPLGFITFHPLNIDFKFN